MVQDLDACYLKGYHLSHNTFLKIQIQDFKNFFCSKKSKLKDQKFAPPYENMAELAKKEDKKKRFQGHRQKCTGE